MSEVTPQLARGALHLTVTFDGEQREQTFYKAALVVGRAGGSCEPDLDLSADNTVSRRHARILSDAAGVWIEDLGSKFGSTINGQDIRGRGKVRIEPGNSVRLGNTAINIERRSDDVTGFAEIPPARAAISTVEISNTVKAATIRSPLPRSSTLDAFEQQAVLLEILVQFSLPGPLDQLLRTILGRVVELIPGARRGALLLYNAQSDKLLLAAFVSSGEPAVSETLARRALVRQQAFVWRNNFGVDYAMSIQRHHIESGMYAPLIYNGQPLGVLCVDNPGSDAAFSEEDLHLLVTVADHAAVAVSHHQLRDELQRTSSSIELLAKLNPKFPAAFVQRLTAAGTLPIGTLPESAQAPGLHHSQASVLAIALCQPPSGAELPLHFDPFSCLAPVVEIVSRFGGTFDRIGAETVAVFGAPVADRHAALNAVRAGLAIRDAVAEINKGRLPAVEASAVRIGIGFGNLAWGFLTCGDARPFVIAGDPLQHALFCCNAATNGEILAGPQIPSEMSPMISFSPVAKPSTTPAYKIENVAVASQAA